MTSSPENQFGQIEAERLRGDEEFRFGAECLPFSVHDFWAWSVSDLVSNATRGRLAEYIVAKACGVDTSQPRDEWAPVDLETPEGHLVEVKSAAYVQSWHQKRLSQISFGVSKTRKWDPHTNEFATEKTRSADVYVFALLAHRNQATIDPLNLDQWEFYVLPTCVLDSRKRSQHSITLPSFQGLNAGPYGFNELREQVHLAAHQNRRTRQDMGVGPPSRTETSG